MGTHVFVGIDGVEGRLPSQVGMGTHVFVGIDGVDFSPWGTTSAQQLTNTLASIVNRSFIRFAYALRKYTAYGWPAFIYIRSSIQELAA